MVEEKICWLIENLGFKKHEDDRNKNKISLFDSILFLEFFLCSIL
jgi:hypothetical protein